MFLRLNETLIHESPHIALLVSYAFQEGYGILIYMQKSSPMVLFLIAVNPA